MVFDYTREEIQHSFKSAPNINAALKNFMKQEIEKGDSAAKFVKALKTALQSKSPDALPELLDRALPKYETHTFVISRYAHNDCIEPLLAKIIEEYASDFNNCYQTDGASQIEISDKATFEKIARDVEKLTGQHLQESNLPENGFMKNSVFYSLFEPLVLQELKPIFSK